MFEFYRKVPKAGFEWVTTTTFPVMGSGQRPQRGEFLAERNKVGHLAEYRRYQPLAETGLFMIFAEVASTQDEVLRFANEYGFMGLPISIAQPSSEGPNSYRVHGECFNDWSSEIGAMRHAIDLWQGAQRGDFEFLSRFIEWHGADAGHQRDGVSYLGPAGPDGKIDSIPLASPRSKPRLMTLFKHGDVVMPARHALHVLLNRKMEKYGSVAKIFWDRSHRTPTETLRIVPRSLISALWIQFANAIQGDRTYRQCDACRKWFEISGARRSDARFCTDACRFRAYRGRQSDAVKLSAAGSSPKEIAMLLGSNTETVKGWIREVGNVKTKTRKL